MNTLSKEVREEALKTAGVLKATEEGIQVASRRRSKKVILADAVSQGYKECSGK